MSNALLVGISGLRAHQEKLQVIGNNLANVDTTAYKSSRALFSDLVYQTVKEANSGAIGIEGSVNPSQVGSGTTLAQIDRDLSQGNLEQTGRTLDMAIEGSGYFVLQNADGPAFTRAGAFGISKSGILVNPSTGTPLQRVGDAGEPDGVNPGFQTNGDNQINVPLGARFPSLASSSIAITGSIPRDATASIANVLQSGRFLAGGVAATETTPLNDLDVNESAYGANDEIRISGIDVDGSPVTVNIQVDASTTVGDLVTAIDAAFTNADVVFGNGTIQATAQTPGNSRLTIRLDDRIDTGTGATNFSTVQLTDLIEGTDATSVSFTSTEVFNVRGSSLTLDLDLTKQDDGSWTLTADIDPELGTIVDGTVTDIRFADDGSIIQFGGSETGDVRFVLRYDDIQLDQEIEVGFGDIGTLSGLSQTGDDVSSLIAEANGYANGTFNDITVDADGKIFGIADNGIRFPLAQIAIASFSNPDGLKALGNNEFVETLASGTALIGTALGGGRGAIRPGQLEGSNVDLTAEFARLIIAQRGFSANARTVTVTDQILEELTNIIR